MTREQQVLYVAVAMFAAWPSTAEAATVVVANSTFSNITNNNSVTVALPTVANANQLVSMSAGSVSYPEGGTLTVSVNYVGGSSAQIFNQNIGLATLFNLNTLANLNFATGDVNGLTFLASFNSGIGSGSIPSQTQFTFNTVGGGVPEPASWAMMLTGFGMIGYGFRRRRKVAAITA